MDQIAYDTAITRADPTIVARGLTGEISEDAAATPVTDGVGADIQDTSEAIEVVGPALGELAASLQVSEQDLISDILDGENESA